MAAPMVYRISGWQDPRLAGYRNLKDRQLARDMDCFVVEGENLVRRLIASGYEVQSLLVSEKRSRRLLSELDIRAPVYVAPEAIISRVVGFEFHRGILALGQRQSLPTMADWAPADPERFCLVVVPEINDPENLGRLLRNAAAFGVDAVALGESCCDPFARRCIRTSVGTLFTLPLFRSIDLKADLVRLKEEQTTLIATTLNPAATSLDRDRGARRLAILFGTEAHGLADPWISLCDRQVTIPMKRGTDSLNVAVAAGIVLYHYGVLNLKSNADDLTDR